MSQKNSQIPTKIIILSTICILSFCCIIFFVFKLLPNKDKPNTIYTSTLPAITEIKFIDFNCGVLKVKPVTENVFNTEPDNVDIVYNAVADKAKKFKKKWLW